MNGKEKGEGLARWGSVLVWLSVITVLLSVAIFLSFMLFQVGSGIDENDFKNIEGNTYSATMEVDSMDSISCTINAEEEMLFSMEVEGPDGIVYDIYEESTPAVLDITPDSSGSYEFRITVLDDGDFDDMDISIYSLSFGAVFMCCGVGMLGVIFMALLITGFVFLLVAIYKRNRKELPRRPGYQRPPPLYYQRPQYRPPPPYGGGYGPPPGGPHYGRGPYPARPQEDHQDHGIYPPQQYGGRPVRSPPYGQRQGYAGQYGQVQDGYDPWEEYP